MGTGPSIRVRSRFIQNNFTNVPAHSLMNFSRHAKLALQFIPHLLQPGSIAGHQNQIVMVFGEELGQFVSDAAGSAGDQCGRRAHSQDVPQNLSS